MGTNENSATRWNHNRRTDCIGRPSFNYLTKIFSNADYANKKFHIFFLIFELVVFKIFLKNQYWHATTSSNYHLKIRRAFKFLYLLYVVTDIDYLSKWVFISHSELNKWGKKMKQEWRSLLCLNLSSKCLNCSFCN